MWQEIGKLFSTKEIIPVIFIAIGLIFCIIEIFRSKSSAFGIIGGVLIIASLIAVMMLGGSATQFIFLIVLVFLIIIIAYCVMTIVTENGILLKKPKNIKEDELKKEELEEKTLNKLLGKEGNTLTELNPEGKIQINGVTLNAMSNGDRIDKNSQIKIIKVDGIQIIVKKVDIDVK